MGPDPGVGLGGSAVVGDPGTPQQLHLTSALLGQMAGAGWVTAATPKHTFQSGAGRTIHVYPV